MERTLRSLSDSTLERTRDTEDAWVERAAHGDQAAFAGLYDSCIERIYRHVYYRVSNHADAEDIVQEVFVRAWKAIGRYRATGTPLVAWLITIAHNLVVDHYRSRKKATRLEEANVPGDCGETDPEGLMEASHNRAQIRKAVLRLKGDKQKVILMRFIDGFSCREVAQALNKSEGAVRVIQYRALNELKQMLKAE